MPPVTPAWPVSTRVHAFATTKAEGNLATHVGDAGAAARNRKALIAAYGLPAEPMWLNQVHGNAVAVGPSTRHAPTADAAYTRAARLPLAVMVADCLPVLFAAPDGSEIGVAHAGWRGLASGVLATALGRFESRRVVAWLGPSIGPCHYEVDEVVRREFRDDTGFTEGRDSGHWMMDLCAIARGQLSELGISAVYGGGYCTWCDASLFSHRRDGAARPGRTAALIWKS